MTESPNPSRVSRIGTLRRLYLLLRSNWLTSSGSALMTLAVLGFITAMVLNITGQWSGPYLGILLVIVLPAVFAFGLLLVPAGLFLYRRQMHERLERLADRPLYLARAVVGLTLINFAAVATVGYAGVSFMSSVKFCGEACHSAMQPEYDTYRDSAHANVECVACHVGPGANAFVQSKINGAKQLLSFVRDNYSRPIPTPVHNLRPATETCENCHWPNKYLGTKLLVNPHFREDEQVSQFVNVVLMRTGGTRADGRAVGVHWHVQKQAKVEYVAGDPERKTIPWMRVVHDGEQRVYAAPGVALDPPPAGEIRTMDCNDCHNRSAHDFDSPGEALDKSIATGLISRSLPFVKKHAMEALGFDWTRDDAAEGIRKHLQKAYAAAGLLDEEHRQLLEGAIAEVVKIWRRNVYPDRGVLWDTYTDFNSHVGCFRCHDGEHRAADGRVVTHECDACHVVLSEEEEDPAILQSFGLRGR